MKQFSKDLGNVSLAPKGRWSKEQEYERLNLVYNSCDNLSYVAKIDVPIGVEIDNREYWQPMNATGYADNNFINLTTESENGTVTAYESLEEAVATILPINRRAGATLSFYNLNSDRLDRQAEFELWQFNSTDLSNWEIRDYWNNIYYNWNVFAGWYVGADGLKNHVKIPNVGQYAYVGTNLNDALLYQCRTNGTWTNTGIKVRNYISVVVSGNITIGNNGNWFSDGKDTGIPATPAVDEQLDNIIMQLQQHTTEINNLKAFDANLQDQITSNDSDITDLTAKHESLSRTVQGISATGGASTATNVTYNNNTSGLNAENAQDAIDELQSSKFDKTSILQESGEAEDKVMSQKAVSDKLSELTSQSKRNVLYPKTLPYTDGYFVGSNGGLVKKEGAKYYGKFLVTPGDTIVYTGNYGGFAVAIIYYNNEGNILIAETKQDLGQITKEFTVPDNAVYAYVSSYKDTLEVYIKGGVIDTINSLEKNKLNKEEFNKIVVDIKRNEDVLSKTTALYSKAFPFIDGYYVGNNGELIQHEDSKYYGYFKVTEGETIVYTGNYGAACLAIAYYDENYKFLSGESTENLGPTTRYFTVPQGAVYAIASTFKGNFDIRLSNSLIQDIVALQNSKEELNSDVKQSLSKKFRNFDDHFAYMREVDRAVLFAAFVPKKGYENDEMKIIALSAYYNNLADDEIPTRFDFWVYNSTKQKDFYQYINKDVDNQNRYQKIYHTGEMGTLYALLDTDVLRAHKNTDNKYAPLIFGTVSKFIINSYSSIDENPFLNPILWESNKKNPHTFTMAWFGTSIPASSYPTVVGELLGCTVYNEAVGESLVRLGWGKNCIASGDTIDKWGCSGKDTSKFNPASNTLAALAKSLSASIEEKQYLIDNIDHFKEITNYTGDFPYTNEQIKGFSYENKLLKYIDSSRQDYIKTDLIVFDHGHNDLNPDGDPIWSSYDIANRTKDNYWGAMNFLMDIIRKYNPHQNVCQISHYQGDVDYSSYYYKTQQKFADHWGIPFIELYKVTQLSTTEKVRTSGWWGYTDGLWHESGFVFNKNSDGTFTTNQSCIIQYDFGISNGSYDTTTQTFTSKIMEIPTTTVSRDIKEEGGKTTCLLSPRECFMKDRLHPLSDKSKVAVNRIAEWLASMLNSIYKIQ